MVYPFHKCILLPNSYILFVIHTIIFILDIATLSNKNACNANITNFHMVEKCVST